MATTTQRLTALETWKAAHDAKHAANPLHPATHTHAAVPPPAGNGFPTTDLAGWKLIVSDDFTKAAAEGQFLAVYTNMYAYPYDPGWTDTPARHIAGRVGGRYDPGIISAHDGMADVFIRTVAGEHKIAAFGPRLAPKNPAAWQPYDGSDQLYGRYAIRAKVDIMPKYKAAWLTWPKSETWPRDGEIDFPEADFDGALVSAFMHRQNGVDGGDQDYFGSSANMNSWHTYVTEWTPTRCEFFIDGTSIGKATSRIPNTPMHYVIQNETWLGTGDPIDSTQGHVLVDWVAIWAYAP